jgi:DNA-binding CsgD family transcriptional regulator
MNQVEPIRLVGRDFEFHVLTKMLAEGATGHAGALTVTLEGPSGVGKTRLLGEAAELARQNGYRVLWQSVQSVGASSAGHAVRTALRPPGDEQAAAPRLIVVDGIHNAPPRTANIIIGLLHSEPVGREVRLIGLQGPHHGRNLERRLGDTSNFSRIELDRLAFSAGIELAGEILQARLGDGLAAMVAGAGGNPLVISELARGLREERLCEVVEGEGRLRKRRIPRRVQNVARCWLDLLSEPARQLVQVAAAADGPFMVDEVAELCRETTASLLPALDEAMCVGLLSCLGEHLVFPQELIRRSVLDNLPTPVRRALKKEFDTLRNQRGSSAAAPAEFLPPRGTGAFPVPVRPTVPVLPTVLGRPTVLGPPALAFDSLADRLMPALLMAKGTRAEPLPPGQAEQLRAELAPRLCAENPERADRAAHSIVSLFTEDRQRVMEIAGAILASHPDGSTAPDALVATVVLSNLTWVSGNLTDGLRWGERALDAIATDMPPVLQTYPMLSLASKLSDIGRFDEAERLLGRADREVDRLGATEHRAAALIVRAGLLLQSSRLRAARDTVQAGLAATTADGRSWVLPAGQAVLILTAVRCGDLASAADHVWRCRAMRGADSTLFPSIQLSWAEFIVASASLSAKRSTELLTTQYSTLLTQEHLYVEEVGTAPWFTRLALAADDAPLAASVVAAVERLAAANPEHRSVEVSAMHARALLERDTGALRWASREHVSPCSGALADEDLGLLLAAQGEKHSALASASLRSALERFEMIGAHGDAERVRGRLKDHDASSPRRSSDAARPVALRSATARLTENEQTIAQLVVRGLTNRQIARRVNLSPHTVNYHLRVIFRKLNIGSRVEIARHVAYSD